MEVKERPIGPDDMADSGLFTFEYDDEEELALPVIKRDAIAVTARNEGDSEAGTCGGSDRPLDSPHPNFGTPQDGSPMQGITVP